MIVPKLINVYLLYMYISTDKIISTSIMFICNDFRYSVRCWSDECSYPARCGVIIILQKKCNEGRRLIPEYSKPFHTNTSTPCNVQKTNSHVSELIPTFNYDYVLCSCSSEALWIFKLNNQFHTSVFTQTSSPRRVEGS